MSAIAEQADPAIPGFHLITAVWGRRFTDFFLDVSLPNQLVAGNVDAFADLPASRYRIFTSAGDAERIASSPQYASLRRVIDADITIVDDLEGGERRILSMTSCHRRAIVEANADGAALVFLSPDSVVSRGAFAAIRKLAEDGNRAVMAVGLRLRLETFLPAFLDQAAAGGSMAPPPRELVRLALDHLHPISESLFVDSESFNRTPAALCWRAGRTGVLARSFHLHPLMVWPSLTDVVPIGSVDGDYIGRACPDVDEVHVVTDSDDLVAFEFSGADKVKGLTARHRVSAVWVAAWATRHASEHHRRFFRERIRIHAGAEPEAWRRVERDSDRLVRLVELLLGAGPWLPRALYALGTAPAAARKRLQRDLLKPIQRRRKRTRKAKARASKRTEKRTAARRRATRS